MHKFAVTAKPPEAGGVFNGLLAASVAGRSFGDYNGSLSFIRGEDLDNPDAAPRGYSNPLYTAVPRMAAVDPTSPLAIGLESKHRRDPTGTVGYTHHHVAVEHLSHISSMFARWVTEFNVLYAAASAAQAAKNAGQYVRLDSVREVRYTDGDVEAFLAAVGRLDDGNISYPAGQTLDVDIIYNRVMTQLMAELPILDHVGFSVGEEAARSYIGLGTVPRTGQNVCVLSAETYDTLISSPWKRILTIPRVRDMIRAQFEDRLAVAVESANGHGSGLVTIVEGDDVLHIPKELNGAPTTWESLIAAIDSRNELSTLGQEDGTASDHSDSTDSGKYKPDSSGNFADHWLNQFYDKGDLVLALLEENVDVLEAGIHCVLLSTPEVGPTGHWVLGPLDNNSGCLSSTNVIVNAVNKISGALDAVWLDGFDGTDPWTIGTKFVPMSDQMMTTALPNGLLNIGSCGSAKATSWIRILRFLRLNYPQEAKLLMEKSGRSKQTLPQGVNRIASMDSLIAEVLSNGQRDGYINSPALAFNVSRLTRDEQDGPVFAGSTLGAINPGTASASPVMATLVNGWDRTDNSDGRYLITPNGLTVNFEYGTPSRFSGEWDAGRVATWVTDFMSDSAALGSGNVEIEVTRNLLSLPCADDGTGNLQPRYVPFSSGDSSLLFSSSWNMLSSIDNPEEYSLALMAVEEFGGYGASLTMESYHLTRGFMRGLAQRQFANNDKPEGEGPGFHAPRTYGNIAASGRIDMVSPTTTTASVGTGSKSVTTYDASVYSPKGEEFKDSNGAGTPYLGWFWDPNRTQMFGSSVHRWAGVYFDSILPHPYLRHPIAVSTAYCRLSDLLGREDPNESDVAVVLAGNPSATLSALGYELGGLVQIDRSEFVSGGAADQSTIGGGSIPSPIINNSSTSWKGYVSSDISANLVNGNGVTDYGWLPYGVPTKDTAEVLPAAEMQGLIRNGCSRLGAPHTRMSILWNGDDQATDPVAGSSSYLTYAPWLVEGETEVYLADGYSVVTDICPDSALIIRGKGLLFEGDLYTASFNDIMAWYVQIYSGERSLVFSPFPGYWAPYSETAGFISVAAPQVGTNHNLNADQISTLKPATTSVGVNLVQNDWFRKGTELSPKHARMRSGGLVNPWIRAGATPGMVHLRYDNSMLGPIFAAMEKQFIGLGSTMVTGLTNSLFLEVQMAN